MVTIQTSPSIRAAMSVRSDCNMDFRFGEQPDVLAAQKRFMELNQFDYAHSVFLSVQHGNEVYSVTAADISSDKPAVICTDGIMTNTKGITLCLFTADCTPLIIHDAVHNAVALLHIGWKPLHTGIIEHALAELSLHYGTVPSECTAHLGAGIQAASYIQTCPQQKDDSRWVKWIRERDGVYHIDIPGCIKETLQACGVLPEHIMGSDVDTASDERYFSHYRSKRTLEQEGRMLTCVMIL